MKAFRLIIPALMIMLGAVGSANAQPVSVGTFPPGTLTFNIADSFAKVLLENQGMAAVMSQQSGSSGLLAEANKGDIDLVFVNTLELDDAYNGRGFFEGRPQKNLRTLGVLFPVHVGVFVKADSPIRTVEDLRGKRLSYGYTEHQSLRVLFDGVLANANLKPTDFTQVIVPNLIRNVDEFISGNTDAAFFAIGQGKVKEASDKLGGIRFIDFIDRPDRVEAMGKAAPTTYVGTVDRANNYLGVNGPTKTMFYDYVAVTNIDPANERVRDLVNTFFQRQTELGNRFGLYRSLDTSRMFRNTGVPYHDGAIAAYQARGMQLLDK
jgi:TRAP transporter TAXI family solute receptor